MTRKLSKREYDTLNAAIGIILSRTPHGASWSLAPHNYHGVPGCYVTYFDSRKGQHDMISGETFADKIRKALDFEARALSDEESYRASRIKALRKELANLEGETL